MSIYQGARVFKKNQQDLENLLYSKIRIITNSETGDKDKRDIEPSRCYTRFKKEKTANDDADYVEFYFKHPFYDKQSTNIINNIKYDIKDNNLIYYSISFDNQEFSNPGSIYAKSVSLENAGILINNKRYYFIDETQNYTTEESIEDTLTYPFKDFSVAFLVAFYKENMFLRDEETVLVIMNEACIPITYKTPKMKNKVTITSYSSEIEELLNENFKEEGKKINIFNSLPSPQALLYFTGIDTWETRFYCNCDIHFYNLCFSLRDIEGYGNNSGQGTWIFAQNHNLILGKNLKMLSNLDDIYDDSAGSFLVSALKMYIMGGYECERDNIFLPTEMAASTIQIESGEYWFVGGWNKKYSPSGSEISSKRIQQFMRSKENEYVTIKIGNNNEANDLNNQVKINRVAAFSTGPQFLSAKSTVKIELLDNFTIRVLHPLNQNLIDHYYNKGYFTCYINFILEESKNNNFLSNSNSTIVYNTIDSAEQPIRGEVISSNEDILKKCQKVAGITVLTPTEKNER